MRKQLSQTTKKAVPIIILGIFAVLLDSLFVMGFSRTALAQSPITARVDRSTIAADEQLVLTVTVSGDFLTIPQPNLSQLQDFVVVNSRTSTQVSIVNGNMTSQGLFIYTLQPLLEGNLEVPPISVNIDGTVHQTDPIAIEILPGGTRITPPENMPQAEAPQTLQGQDFFVEAEVNNPNPYLGEQIIYTFRLYQASNFFGQPDYQPPSFTDFWSSEILAQPHYNTQVGGREYLVSEILTALFPANLGELTIEPARLIIPGGLLSPDIEMETRSVTVNVQPLPEGAPQDFNGAVGQFEINATLSEVETKVNEPLTLVVDITGTGNIETLTEPDMPELSNWRFFDSTTNTTTETGDGVLSGSRQFERLVVPGQAGEQTFPPISFSYYDPNTGDYRTVSTNPIPIMVQPDDSAQGLPLIAGVDDAQRTVIRLTSDIRHIKSVPHSLDTAQPVSSVLRTVYVSAWILPLFAMAVAFVWKKRQTRLQDDTAYARSLFAKKTANKILNEAGQPGADGTAAAGRALLGYLSDKLDTPTAGLTTANLLNLLRESGLDSTLVDRVDSILYQVEVGRYAPVSAGDEQAIIADSRQLISDLEKAF